MRIETKSQNIILFDRSWEHALKITQMFWPLHMSTNGRETALIIDFGVASAFWWVGEFVIMESAIMKNDCTLSYFLSLRHVFYLVVFRFTLEQGIKEIDPSYYLTYMFFFHLIW